MADKIQEITEKIYNEGVVKASKEAEVIIADAHAKAEQIISLANQEKKKNLEQTEKEVSELKRMANSEIELAAQKLINNLKQEIANMLITKQVDSSVKDAFASDDFVKEMILLVVKKWIQEGSEESALNLIVSPGEEKKIAGFFESKLVGELNRGLEINVDPNVKSGFKIGPSGGSYIISFTEDDFKNYFKSYLKEKTWDVIFGSHST